MGDVDGTKTTSTETIMFEGNEKGSLYTVTIGVGTCFLAYIALLVVSSGRFMFLIRPYAYRILRIVNSQLASI